MSAWPRSSEVDLVMGQSPGTRMVPPKKADFHAWLFHMFFHVIPSLHVVPSVIWSVLVSHASTHPHFYPSKNKTGLQEAPAPAHGFWVP